METPFLPGFAFDWLVISGAILLCFTSGIFGWARVVLAHRGGEIYCGNRSIGSIDIDRQFLVRIGHGRSHDFGAIVVLHKSMLKKGEETDETCDAATGEGTTAPKYVLYLTQS